MAFFSSFSSCFLNLRFFFAVLFTEETFFLSGTTGSICSLLVSLDKALTSFSHLNDILAQKKLDKKIEAVEGDGVTDFRRGREEGSDGTVPTTIMVGVNESTVKGYPHPSISSCKAFEWVLKKLVRPSNSPLFKLLFLHVQVPDEDGFTDMDSIYASPQDFQDIKQRDKLRGVQLLQYFVSQCHELGICCEAWIKQGDPKEVISNEVKRVQPDILVVGSRCLGPFQRVFVGTVSEFLTKHAVCPVIVIKRKASEAPEPEDPVDD